MSREIRFFCPGIPAPGGSKHAFGLKKGGVYTGRVGYAEDSGNRTKFWRAAVGEAAYRAIRDNPIMEGPIELDLLFHFLRPKDHFRKDGSLKPSAPAHHVKVPDAGKVARSTTDACKGILWRDDKQIVKETHSKAYTLVQAGCWLIAKEL